MCQPPTPQEPIDDQSDIPEYERVYAEKDLVGKFLASDEFSRVQGKLISLAASVGFERGLSMHQTKDEFAIVLKKMTGYAFLNKISEHAAEPLLVILQLEPEKLVCPTNVPTPRDARVSPHVAKESTVTPASKSLELSANVDLTAFVVASEHNEEMVSAEVDGSDPKMTDDTITTKSEHEFVQGMSVVLDDALELAGVGSGHVSSGPNDVVVPLSAGEKGDGLTPLSVASKEAIVNPSRGRDAWLVWEMVASLKCALIALIEVDWTVVEGTVREQTVGLVQVSQRLFCSGLNVYHLPPASSVVSEQDELPSSVGLDFRAQLDGAKGLCHDEGLFGVSLRNESMLRIEILHDVVGTSGYHCGVLQSFPMERIEQGIG
ncbi:hypothetical protein Tco_1522307 [Tanacetum coccineum]